MVLGRACPLVADLSPRLSLKASSSISTSCSCHALSDRYKVTSVCFEPPKLAAVTQTVQTQWLPVQPAQPASLCSY